MIQWKHEHEHGHARPSMKGNEMNTYTDLENEVIDAFIIDDGRRYSFFDEGLVSGSCTWTSIFIEECGDPKIFRGVISSLIKKGFFRSNGEGRESSLWLTDIAENEINSRKPVERKSELDVFAAYLEGKAEAAKTEKMRVLEHIGSTELLSSSMMDGVFEADAKYFAAKTAAVYLARIIEQDLSKEESMKVLRDRIMYDITRGYEAKSTSPSSNHIQNSQHFALINLLNEI